MANKRDMSGKYDFREPLLIEDSGLYITAAQMHFYLNRRNGQKEFEAADEKFMRYYRNCCLYNVVYDMMEENPKCGIMYWDDTNGSVALSFPVGGEIAKALTKVDEFSSEMDEDDDDLDDPFGIIK
jgi:hypothetical protein|tara:strand:- start:672 stop:1049 length:378 start_codon:yes stop_codon:yes gene_type:complete